MLGVLNDVPLVDLATDIAKALCKTLDLKEGKTEERNMTKILATDQLLVNHGRGRCQRR